MGGGSRVLVATALAWIDADASELGTQIEKLADGSTAEQLALLTKREPVADGVLVDLLKRRVDVTRDRLVKSEGIPPERLNDTIPSAAPEPVTGEGRVEFGIAAGDD